MLTDHNDSRANEASEPLEGANPLPRYVLVLMVMMFIWGLIYIYTASFDLDTYETDSDEQSNALVSNVDSEKQEVDGAAIFQSKCVACHQATGTGVPGVFPPLAGSEWVLGNPSILSHILLKGIQGELTVNDVKYNGMMPAFSSILSDAEIAAVLTHIRSAWGNSVDPVLEASVIKIRADILNKVTPYNGDEELSKIQ
jgi:mono/diheme cytochrome c family protein